MGYPDISLALPEGAPPVMGTDNYHIPKLRYFRQNRGVNDGIEIGARLIPNPLQHFDVETQLLGSDIQDGTLISQNVSNTGASREFQIFVQESSGGLRAWLGGVQVTVSASPTAGVYRFMFDGTALIATRDGVEIHSSNPSIGSASEPSATTTFGFRHAGTLSSYGFIYDGAQANVRIRNQSGSVIHSYAVGDNSDTIVDSVGGNNGTVINGNASDWGRFESLANGNWRGVNLSVPPWSATDQTLVVA